ncbi:MAG: DUF1080 domain-containing protein [Planctomycetes bacterium]|nr:DUF1080 domain-containing protein [Planctomycetota bacterium]
MARDRIWTSQGETGWTSILGKDGLEGLAYDGQWTREGNALCIDARNGGAWLSASGEIVDFEFRARLTAPARGGNASIFFRQHGEGKRYYQFDLRCAQQAVVVSKTDNGAGRSAVISSVNHEIVAGRAYAVEIAVRGESITTYVDGQPANQVRDADFAKGAVTLTAWKSQVRFEDPCLRVY